MKVWILKHAELILYGSSTIQSDRSRKNWYERLLIWWHGIKLPKTRIAAAIIALLWLVITIIVFAIGEDRYSDSRTVRYIFLTAGYWIFGALLGLFGVLLAHVLFGMGGHGDAHKLRTRIVLLSMPASLCIIARGFYFALELPHVFNVHPIGIAVLGILTENVPCLLLLILMWPIPKPVQVDTSYSSYSSCSNIDDMMSISDDFQKFSTTSASTF